MKTTITIIMGLVVAMTTFGALVYNDVHAKFKVGDCIISKYRESWERKEIYQIKEVGNYEYHSCSTRYKCEDRYQYDDKSRYETDRNYVKTECP